MSGDAERVVRISMVRHGEIHEGDFYYGRLPGSWLGESGQRQAQAVADDLARVDLCSVYHSPLLRTSQTAAAIAERHAGVLRVSDERLLEVKTPFDGRPKVELEGLGYDLYSGAGSDFEQPGDVLARTSGFLADVCRRHPGGHVVAVSHGDLILFLLGWGLGMVPDLNVRKRLPEAGLPEPYPAWCSVTTLDFMRDAGEWKLFRLAYRNPAAGIGETVFAHAAAVLEGKRPE